MPEGSHDGTESPRCRDYVKQWGYGGTVGDQRTDGVERAQGTGQERWVEYNGWPGGKDVGRMKCNTDVRMVSRGKKCARV